MRKIIRPCGLHCIKVNHLGVALGGQEILTDINLHIHCGSLNVVIGRNGAGKSTLIRAILGDIAHTGNIEFKDRENGHIQKLKIGYVPQSMNVEKQTPVSVYDMIASYQSNVPVFLMRGKKIRRGTNTGRQGFLPGGPLLCGKFLNALHIFLTQSSKKHTCISSCFLVE